MKLWKISQTKNSDYDTYDSAVVAAETEEAARLTHPGGETDGWWTSRWYLSCWAEPQEVLVSYIGEAAPNTKPGVIVTSFNAG